MNIVALMDDLERDTLKLAIYVMELAEDTLREEAQPVSRFEARIYQLMALVLASDEPVTHTYLRRQSGCCPRTMRKALALMEKRGWIVRSGQKTWQRISVRRAA